MSLAIPISDETSMTVVASAKYSISPNSSKKGDFAAQGHHILTPGVLVESQSVEPSPVTIAK